MLLAASQTHLLFCTVRKVAVLDTAHSIRIWSLPDVVLWGGVCQHNFVFVLNIQTQRRKIRCICLIQ